MLQRSQLLFEPGSSNIVCTLRVAKYIVYMKIQDANFYFAFFFFHFLFFPSFTPIQCIGKFSVNDFSGTT